MIFVDFFVKQPFSLHLLRQHNQHSTVHAKHINATQKEVSTRRRTLWLILQYLKRSRTFVALVESVLHSHVRGFNIGPLWRVGWTERAAGVLCSMIKNGKNEGLGIWLAGQPGNWENRRKLGFLPFYSLLSFQRALYDGLRSLADFLLSKCVNRSIANFLFSLTTKTLTPKSAS